MKNRSVLVIGGVALLTVLAAVSGSTVVAQTGSSSDDPDITNYEVTSSGEEITVSFDSDENLVNIEVDVRGPDEGTLTEEDFDGDRFEGYEATYRADSDGEYTLELVTAEDSSNDDGADDGDYSDSTSIQTSDNDSDDETPTDNGTPTDGTPTDDGTPDGETPTDDGTPDGETPTDDETPTEDSMDDDTPTEDSMDDETESPTDGDGTGFGGAIAVGALLASLLLFYRRH